MPKLKTHRGAAKRFSLTGTGKVKTQQGLCQPYSDDEDDQDGKGI